MPVKAVTLAEKTSTSLRQRSNWLDASGSTPRALRQPTHYLHLQRGYVSTRSSVCITIKVYLFSKRWDSGTQ
jgi:hypothetical protein